MLDIHDLGKSWQSGDRWLAVLKNLSLTVAPGERVAVMGESGSGKTTLLNLIAGIDIADDGRIRLLGRDVTALAEPELTRLRARHIGLVFQDFNLLDTLTVAENIEIPLWLNGQRQRARRVREIAAELRLDDLLQRFPPTLSGGQQQRVAIARALAHQPGLILADEPTGNLDYETAGRVLQVLREATEAREVALLLATHSDRAAAICHRTYHLRAGRLE